MPGAPKPADTGQINWFMQATPYDNLGHELPPKELIGLMTFSFDLIIPGAEPLTAERSYISSNNTMDTLCYGWSLNHFGLLKLNGKNFNQQGNCHCRHHFTYS